MIWRLLITAGAERDLSRARNPIANELRMNSVLWQMNRTLNLTLKR